MGRERPKDCYARIKNFYNALFWCAIVTLKIWDWNGRPGFSKFAHPKEFKVIAHPQFETCKKMSWIHVLRFRRANERFARKMDTKKKKWSWFLKLILIWPLLKKKKKSLRSPYKFSLLSFFVFLPQTHCHPSRPYTTHSRKCGKPIVSYTTSGNRTRPPFYPPLIPANATEASRKLQAHFCFEN